MDLKHFRTTKSFSKSKLFFLLSKLYCKSLYWTTPKTWTQRLISSFVTFFSGALSLTSNHLKLDVSMMCTLTIVDVFFTSGCEKKFRMDRQFYNIIVVDACKKCEHERKKAIFSPVLQTMEGDNATLAAL